MASYSHTSLSNEYCIKTKVEKMRKVFIITFVGCILFSACQPTASIGCGNTMKNSTRGSTSSCCVGIRTNSGVNGLIIQGQLGPDLGGPSERRR